MSASHSFSLYPFQISKDSSTHNIIDLGYMMGIYRTEVELKHFSTSICANSNIEMKAQNKTSKIQGGRMVPRTVLQDRVSSPLLLRKCYEKHNEGILLFQPVPLPNLQGFFRSQYSRPGIYDWNIPNRSQPKTHLKSRGDEWFQEPCFRIGFVPLLLRRCYERHHEGIPVIQFRTILDR